MLTSGSVTTMTMRNAAVRALDEKYFHPLITHSSPSSTAEQVNCWGSEPAWGSVIEYEEKTSPSSRGWRYFFFCSSVP
jgi:hypothetical protein